MIGRESKICWANTTNLTESNLVVIGIQDESGSHARLTGTSKAPSTIRKVSNDRDVYTEHKMKCLALPNQGLGTCKVFDYGNIKKQEISESFDEILSFPKIPIGMGGDHSNTTPILKSIAKRHGKISLVYFDAHPDFVSHTRNYYGSVITDSLDIIDVKSSLFIGIRSPEEEEIANLAKYGMLSLTPTDVLEKGPKEISSIISDTVKNNAYISFDMDCLDPAFAPGVSVPVPFGLDANVALYLIKKIVSNGIVGMDIMEVCPPRDFNDVTSHLASRMIGEVISSCKV